MARKYILDTLKYWTQEYGVDGLPFRYHGFARSGHDEGGRPRAGAINPHIVLYGEAWGGGTMRPPLKPTNKENVRGTHLGGFNDNLRDAFVGYHFDNNESAFIQSGSGINNVKHAIEGNWRDWGVDAARRPSIFSVATITWSSGTSSSSEGGGPPRGRRKR